MKRIVTKKIVTVAAGLALCAALVAAPALVQGATKAPAKAPVKVASKGASKMENGNEVLARVNGEAITEQQVLMVMNRSFPVGQPPEELMRRILDNLVEQAVLAQQARKEGLTKDPEVQAQVRTAANAVLARAYLQREAASIAVSGETSRKEYDAHPEKYVQPAQVRLSHILVADQAKAEAAAARLKGGEKFEDVARQVSQDKGSGEKGGDLGWWKVGSINPELEKAAAALKEGEVSAAVKTNFGYHILKLTGRKEQRKPPFEEVEERIASLLGQQEVERLRQELVKKAKVKILLPGPEAAPAKAAPQPGAPASK